MNRWFIAALFVLGVVPSLAPAVDIKNIRPCYTPLGATRTDLKCMPADSIFFSFDIENLAIDAKSGRASYIIIMEFLDPKEKDKDGKEKVIFRRETPHQVTPPLGAARMPGEMYVTMGTKQPPGKYSIRLTVHDKQEKDASKAAKAFAYPIQVVPETLGFIGVIAPTVGIYGDRHVSGFNLAYLGLDAKDLPNAEVTIKVLDDKGVATPAGIKMEFPRDLPEGLDLKRQNIVPLQFPLYLNRVGRFTVVIQATDKVSKKEAELRYPLTVIDVGSVSGK